jgi:tripartite-type tricarboxylate transporter receptor subunit TctC
MKRLTSAQLFAAPKTAGKVKARLERVKLVIVAARKLHARAQRDRSYPPLPVKTVPEFSTYATANPGRISFASSGVGSSIHMSGELFKAMAKIDRRRPCVQGLFNLLFYELLDSFRCLKATGILLIDGGW